jgi:NPCBM/NEW2 domain
VLESPLAKGIAIGLVPIVVLGLLAALALFYPGGNANDPEDGADASSGLYSYPPLPPLSSSSPLPAESPSPSGAAPTPTPSASPSRSKPKAASPDRPTLRTPASGRAGNRSRPAVVREVDRRLADLPFRVAANFWGPVERNASNGEEDAGDGRTMSIEGNRFSHGLGVHAPAQVEFSLGGRCSALGTYIGLDDEEGSDPRKNVGEVVFSVSGDGKTLYSSPVVTPDDEPRPVAVDVSGVRVLTLEVDHLGDTRNDHADWAAATLRCRASS